jgi:hypothetical protein
LSDWLRRTKHLRNNYSAFDFSFLKSTKKAMLNTIDKPVRNPMINEIGPLSSTKWFSKILIANEICPIAKKTFKFLIIASPEIIYLVRPNGPELSCGVTTFINVLSAMRSNICGAQLLQIYFLARREYVPKLQPSA